MVTALNSTPNKVKGIEYGADDYVDKPFDLQELYRAYQDGHEAFGHRRL